MDYADITYEVADRIATVTLNRPEARNGYTVRMADELGDAMDRADADEDVRVVVLTGNGKDFCVGADLSSGGFDFDLAEGPGPEWQEPAGRCSKRIFTMNKPVIAAMNGPAVGIGASYALACDIRVAVPEAYLLEAFINIGLAPDGGVSWLLPRLAGTGVAFEMFFSGKPLPAADGRG